MNIFGDPYEKFLLDFLITKLESGSNTRIALILYEQQIKSNGDFKKRLQAAIKELEVGKESIDTILLKNKFLTPFQYGLIQNAPSLLKGLKLIKTLEKSQTNLLKHMIYPIFFPLATISATLYILLIYLELLQKDVTHLQNTNPGMIQFLGIPPYFDVSLVSLLLFISLLLIVILFSLYYYSHLYKPQWIYKVLKTQCYADGIVMFRMIHEMLKTGIPFHNVAKLLSSNYYNKGLRSFFKELANTIAKNKPLYEVFERYNFPVIVSADMKLSEMSKISYEQITQTLYKTSDLMYAKMREEKKIQSIF